MKRMLVEAAMQWRQGAAMQPRKEAVMQPRREVVTQPRGLAAAVVGEWVEGEVVGSVEVEVMGLGAADLEGVHTQVAPG